MTDNTNPGNFANRSKEEVKEIASKGGQASHSGGFASMKENDPERLVSFPNYYHVSFPGKPMLTIVQQEIASKGGQASSGSFEPGSEKAKEAGRKGGQSS